MVSVHARAPSRCADVRLLGADVHVMCADGRPRRYANLDYAASTPALPEVWDAVAAFMPWYSSVHRGSGAKSQVATEAFEDARDDVRAFVGAARDDDVVLVRNTTEAINVLAAALPPGTRVLGSPVEHHANMLPWRRHDLELLPFPASADALCEACEQALRGARRRFGIVALTGASNVTGEVWPLERLRRSRTGTARGSSSTPRSSRRTGRSTWRRRASTSSPSPATSCTPRSAPGRSWARSAGSGTPPRSSRAAARSSS